MLHKNEDKNNFISIFSSTPKRSQMKYVVWVDNTELSLLSLDCEYLQIFGEGVIVAIVTKAVIGICHVSSVLSTVKNFILAT